MFPFPIISSLREKSTYRIQKFIAGATHIAVLGTNGELYTRGYNTWGQLGSTSYGSGFNNTWQLSLTNVSSVFGTKSYNTIAIKNDGTVWFCGKITDNANIFGFTGTANSANSWTEITNYIPFSPSSIKDFQVGYNMTAIVTTDGLLWFCGTNNYGQFGLGNTVSKTTYTQSPVTGVSTLQLMHPLDTTQDVISYIDTAGLLWACGNNTTKQVSSLSTSSFTTFTKMSSQVFKSGVIAGRTSWYVASNGTGLFCGSAFTLQGTNSGILNLYSATGNNSGSLSNITGVTTSGVYGLKTDNKFYEKKFYSGGSTESPLMNNQSNNANWLLQHTMPVSTGVYTSMEMGWSNNAYLLFLDGDVQFVYGIGLMTSTPTSSVYEAISIPDFK